MSCVQAAPSSITEADISTLRAQLIERDAKLRDFVLVNGQLRAEIVGLQKNVVFLTAELKRLLQGRRHVEALDPNQGLLFEQQPLPADPVLPQPLASEAPIGAGQPLPERNGKTEEDTAAKKPRRLDLSRFEREVRVIELPPEKRICPDTGVELQPIGTKVHEELEFTRSKLVVVEHQCTIYGPPPEVAKQRRIAPITAPAPARAIEGCLAGPGLIAHLAVAKFGDYIPATRQSARFGRAGDALPRQTICDWLLRGAFELKPIVTAMMGALASERVVLIDDSPMKCQGKKPDSGDGQQRRKKKGAKEGARQKQIYQAYLWAITNPTATTVVYRFTTGRTANELAPHLHGLKARYVVGDGYTGTLAAFEEAQLDVVHAGCWAHAFRYFRDADKEASAMVRLFLTDIRALYDVEDEATTAKLNPEERARFRREKSRPILARIFNRTRAWKLTFSLSGRMGKAMKYLQNGRRSFSTFLKDGRIPLDNNTTERAMRPVAMGRKNYLFVGSERGGEAAAIYSSLITSCKLVGVDPELYLKDVLGRVGTHPASRVNELTPHQWAETRRVEAPQGS